MSHLAGRIVEIWRYPVSSVGGELISSASVSAMGVAGDRQYVFIDRASGLPAAPEKDRRWRKALYLQAKSIAGDVPTLSFPDGHCYPLNDPSLNDILSDYFGFAIAIAMYHRTGEPSIFPLAKNRYEPSPMHLVTTASLDHLGKLRQVDTIDSRRFRPTVLIETVEGSGFLEDEWIGRRLRLGNIELTAEKKTERCGMTLISQPGIEEDAEILRTILRHNQRHLGIHCSIDTIGKIQVGDELFI